MYKEKSSIYACDSIYLFFVCALQYFVHCFSSARMDVPMNDNPLPSLLTLKVDPPDELAEANNSGDVVLPQVLEDVLALKTQRALELGIETDGLLTELEKEMLTGKEDNLVNFMNHVIFERCLNIIVSKHLNFLLKAFS